jgi:hypothetical protein
MPNADCRLQNGEPPSSESAASAKSAVAERIEAARKQRISTACYDLLAFLRNHNWSASALELQTVNRLNYRARISDLRHDFLVEIVPMPAHPRPGDITIYTVPAHARPRAAWLLEHLSLEGFQGGAVQEELFK